MDRNVYQRGIPLRLETEDDEDQNNTTSSLSLASLNDVNGLKTVWTPAIIFRVSTLSVLMLLTLLGNVIVIITIVSCAELRKKRVNVFILNLTVGDLTVCFVSMPSLLFSVVDQWVLGPVACKLTGYGYVVAVAFPTLLLTTMSIDRYQVGKSYDP